MRKAKQYSSALSPDLKQQEVQQTAPAIIELMQAALAEVKRRAALYIKNITTAKNNTSKMKIPIKEPLSKRAPKA